MTKKYFALLFLFFGGLLSIHAQKSNHVSGQLIVQCVPHQTPDKVVKNIQLLGGVPTQLRVVRELSAPMNAWLLQFNPQVDEQKMLYAVESDPSIQLAQFNHLIHQRDTVPNDSLYANEWQLHNTGAGGGTAGDDIDAQLAWDVTTGGVTANGDTIVACVVEGGNLNHPDLLPNKWVNRQEIPNNGIDDDGNGYVDDYLGWNIDQQNDANLYNDNHGTEVMGMIGARSNNGTGIASINWNVKIMPVAVANTSDEASVVSAYTYPLVMRKLYNETGGQKGAFVVVTNSSWGIDYGNPANSPIWCAFYDSLGTAGVLSCGATANNNVDVDQVGDMPTGCSSDYLISVTATNNNDQRTFSAYGANSVDLGAPGDQIFTTSGTNGYAYVSGTSFASPLTAGVVALLYSAPCPGLMQLAQQDPATAALLVKYAIMQNTDSVASLQGITVTGGRLNAYKSLMGLLANCGDTCITPFELHATVTADTSVTLSWIGNLVNPDFTVRYRPVGDSVWSVADSLLTSQFHPWGLQWCTPYEYQVKSNCSDSSAYSPMAYFTLGGCCIPPDSIIHSDISVGAARLSWNNIIAAQSYNIQYSAEGDTSWYYANAVGDSLELTSLDSCTTYHVQIQSLCASDTTQFSNAFNFTTLGCGACQDLSYCSSISSNSNEEYIDSVQVGPLVNASGNNGGYAFFTSFDSSFTAGTTYPVSLTPGYSSTQYTEYFKIWIDYNQNGQFDNNELAYDAGSGTTQTLHDSITIPTTALSGRTRMRISMKYVGFGAFAPNPCEADLGYGEVEDYCIKIASAPDSASGLKSVEVPMARVYPNPTTGNFVITYPGMPVVNAQVTLFDAVGRQVRVLRLPASGELNISDLAPGIYTLQLTGNSKLLARGKLLKE